MDQSILSIERFTELYPELSRAQIAAITDRSIDTVNGWFSGRQSPSRGDMALLWIYHIRAYMPPSIAEALSGETLENL
jgi:DNA-binding transcriptional regulator YiaG